MYSFITITTLFAAAMAAPARKARQDYPSISFSLIDDVSGANVGSSILADGNAITFYDEFAGTALDIEGQIWATSLQSTTNGAGIVCTISDGEGNQVGLLSEQSTFVDLDGEDTAVEIDVSEFTLVCDQV